MKILTKILLITLIFISCGADNADINEEVKNPWKFAVVGDTHVSTDPETVLEMIPYFIEDEIDLILICGDIVEGTIAITSDEFKAELDKWQGVFQTLYDLGIGVYPVRGNHENGARNNIKRWNEIFTGTKALPQNGPSGETNLTYSFKHKNALFMGLDEYINIHQVNQAWVNQEFEANTQAHIFVFGHEAAFKVFHSDCLDDYPTERNTFWKSLADAGAKVYFCGHDHFFDATLIDDGDGNTQNDIYQCIVGGGGGWLMPNYSYNGENSHYTPNQIYHREQHGYVLVEINGENLSDLDVSIIWKERIEENSTVKYDRTTNIIMYTAY